MTIDVYMQERCNRCADIQNELKQSGIMYDLHFMPPKDSDIEALDYPITEPVLVDEETEPNCVVGHEDVREWVKENCER